MAADKDNKVEAKPPQATATTEYCAELQRWMWQTYWQSCWAALSTCPVPLPQSSFHPPGSGAHTPTAHDANIQQLYDTRNWLSYPYPFIPGASTTLPPGGAQTEQRSPGTDVSAARRAAPEPRAGCEYIIPSPLQRFLAESVDFCILFCVKVTIVLWIMHLSGMKDIAQFITKFIVVDIDENTSMEDLMKIMTVALAHRVLVFVYETMCIWGAGGATPGKFLLGLRVVTYDSSTVVQHNRVRVFPATNVSLSASAVRALKKNLSIAFLIPVFITLFFFRHNRTVYDILAGTIVVQDREGR